MKNKSYLLMLNNRHEQVVIIDFIFAIFGANAKIIEIDEGLLVKYDYNDELDVKEILRAFLYDMNINVKCYISPSLDSEFVDAHLKIIMRYFDNNLKNDVYDDKDLLEEKLWVISDDYKELILKDYMFDAEMNDIIKCLFDNNLNVLQTSKKLYMHRNTLNNKLERFYDKTGFDLRCFRHAVIIYFLVK